MEENKYVIGLDLGGTNAVFGLVDENYEIKATGSLLTQEYTLATAFVEDAAEVISELSSVAGGIENIKAIGIGAPCGNYNAGTIEHAANISWGKGVVPICQMLNEKTGIPVAITNDAKAAALGEMSHGAAMGMKDFIEITLGTGVGSGIIIDGKMLTGCAHGGAEIGHTVIVKDGRQCTCGRRGCFEVYCSATALIADTKRKFEECPDSLMREMCGGDVNRVGGKTAFAAMRKGDKAAGEVVSEYLGYLACGIANILNVFQPEVLCIGGGVSGEKENLLRPLIPLIEKEIYSKDGTLKTDVRIAMLGNDAGIIGAAAAARK